MILDESTQVQEMVHRLEVGAWRKVVLIATLCMAVAGLASLYLFFQFRGLDSETAMDQAQLGRQIASGAGYTTLYIRPMAMWQFLNHEEKLPEGLFPDTYNFPLNPLLNAALLRPIKPWWPMDPAEPVYIGDRVIAGAGVALFLGSLIVFFFILRSLFDSKLAWMSVGLVLVTDMIWRFAVSGLPQMLLLFLFALALLLLRYAIACRDEKKNKTALLLLSGAGLLFGLMTLAQPLSAWIFLGFVVFVFAWFRPRAISGLIVLFLYAAVVAPWLVRNYLVSGNPFGLSIFSILDGTTGSELSFMSNLQPDLSAFGGVRSKLRAGVTGQLHNLFAFIGFNIAAAAFFFSLLHVFRRPGSNMMRWALMLMWVFAALGMAFFPPRGEVSVNQLHALFLPMFVAYGMAFLLVLFNRLNLRFQPARIAFITLVFLASAMPMAVNLLTASPMRVAWPPYVAPFINTVCRWMDQNEVICSDMPWATAWYGNVRSLLLPATVKQFILINDYKYLGGPIGGLYLTPVSGNRPFISQIAKGEYREWASFIMRTADLTRFPLQYFTPLPIDNECVFYSSRDRWTPREQP